MDARLRRALDRVYKGAPASHRAPHRSAASASTAAAPSRAMKRVSLDPTMTRVAMSTRLGSARRGWSASRPRRRGRPLGRRRPASPRPQRAQEIEGLDDARRPRLRGRIVERKNKIAFGRRLQAPLDDRPGLQVVGERDRAEIVTERRAEAGRRRLHRRDPGRDRDFERAPFRLGARSPRTEPRPSRKPPGSPPETTATALPSAASASARRARSSSARLSDACARWSGRKASRVDVRGRSRRCRSRPRSRSMPPASSNAPARGRGRRWPARPLMACAPGRGPE